MTQDQKDSIRFRYLLEMMGSLHDDSATTVTLSSDDATRTWHCTCGTIRGYGYGKREAIDMAIEEAFPGFSFENIK